MDFNYQSFQELLSQFSSSTEAFCASLERSLSGLQRSDAQFREACVRKISELEVTTQENEKVVSAQEKLLERRQESEEELEQRISLVQAQIDQLEAQIRDLNMEIATKSQELKQIKEEPETSQKAPEKLLRSFQMYKQMLQMDISVNNNILLISFHEIGLKTRFVEFSVGEKSLKMTKISDAIQNLDELIDEFEVTGNLGLLVRRIRRGFVQELP